MEEKQLINICIVTPNDPKIVSLADYVLVKLDEGEMGFLINHTPLIGKISNGFVRFNDKCVAVENGIVDFIDNTMTVICQNAQLGLNYQDALDKLNSKKENNLKEAKRKLVDFTQAEHDLLKSLKEAKLGNFVNRIG